MGMKWGVRRYQNKDGSITPKGNERFAKVASSPRLQKKNSKAALEIYRNSMEANRVLATRHMRNAEKAYKRADKHVWKSEKAQRKGNISKYNKEQSKAWCQLAKNITEKSKADSYLRTTGLYKKKISDIENGQIKAGRDFITHTGYGAIIVPNGVIVTSRTSVIEKRRSR